MIHLENLTKEYDVMPTAGKPGQVLATDRLNLDVAGGEIFGLVGPNGAGKTTTLKMVCGLLVPTAGRVTVNGIDVERQPEAAQKHIGYLADFFALYDDLKVWEYLDYFAHAYKMEEAAIAARIDYAIGEMGLEPKRESYIAGLSRGMKQRLGIARAILHDPPVLVLDEPASGLDPKARHELKELLRAMNRAGKTIFITSHVLSDLEEMCSSIAILEKGKLVRAGKIEHVMRPDTPGRRVRIKLAIASFPLADWLGARPEVSAVVPEGNFTSVVFAFLGGDAELADLVAKLVAAGAPMCGVEEVSESLEKIFSRLSTGEIM
ncbi:MAG: ABC transporter ATP-binding protein [Acidobacteria bacterium]|nr:ABC transporter ATP-binding protein [Acidobacteriota bacterium]